MVRLYSIRPTLESIHKIHRLNLDILVALLQFTETFDSHHLLCTIKIVRGHRRGDNFKTPPPPYEQLMPLSTPILRCFWKDFLMSPTPLPHFKHLHCYPPSPSTTTPLPLKNLDRTTWNLSNSKLQKLDCVKLAHQRHPDLDINSI